MSQRDWPNRPYALKADEGWIYRLGIHFPVKASEVHSSSGAAFVPYATRKGKEPPSHTHETEDEMFDLLEGTVPFHWGDESCDAEKGGFIFLPRGVEHGYTITSDSPARLIVVTSPPRVGLSDGWGGFIADLESGQGELVASPHNR